MSNEYCFTSRFSRLTFHLRFSALRLNREEAERLNGILQHSGAIVVWYYAPGFITSEKLDLAQMEKLTGFQFKLDKTPKPMLIDKSIDDEGLPPSLRFGVKTTHWPRFSVADKKVKPWGVWADFGETALAGKEYNGYLSVYSGAAPFPNPILRWLAKAADAKLWSSEPDIVCATEDAVMLVATQAGKRTVALPKPMAPVEDGKIRSMFELEMEIGEVKIFIG